MPVRVFQHSSQGCRGYTAVGCGCPGAKPWTRQEEATGAGQAPLCCAGLPAIISPQSRCSMGKQCPAFSLRPLPEEQAAPLLVSSLLSPWDPGLSECGGHGHWELCWVSGHLLRALPGSISTTLYLCWVHFWLFCFFFLNHWHYVNQHVR